MSALLRFWKQLALTVLLLPCLGGAAHGQNPDSYAKISDVPATYTIPSSRNGLAESAFWLKPTVSITRWEKSATILLNIRREQGTSQNPNPSFKHMYYYNGVAYGDQHVGQAVFQPIRAGMVRYKATVMCNGQSWTQVVDGLGDQFGPVPRDTKASSVTVFVEIASIGEFQGTRPIEDAIRTIRQREADAQRQKDDAAKAAEQARLKKLADDKAAEQARLQKAADAKAAAARQASAAKPPGTASATKTGTAAKTGSGASTASKTTASKTSSSAGGTADQPASPAARSTGEAASSGPDSQAEQARAAARQRQEAADRETARAEAERQRKAEEEAKAQQKQAEYEQWKAQKKQEQSQAEAAALGSTLGLAAMIAELLYTDMGKVDPDFVYRPTTPANYHAPHFYFNTQFGFSGTLMPMLFESNVSTMQKGKAVTIESIKDVQPFWLNLEGVCQVGAESDLYGGYGYWRPTFGISPIFTGYNMSVLSGGVRLFGGLPGAKLYVDVSRNYFSASRSDNDAEESGQGGFDMVLRKRTELGVRFTVHNEAYVRSHISLGFIWERLDGGASSDFRYLSKDGTALLAGPTPNTLGYSLSWKQDHSHQLYVNYFPNYWLSGDINKPKNFSASRYTGSYASGSVGTLLEFGFIRSIDWFSGH